MRYIAFELRVVVASVIVLFGLSKLTELHVGVGKHWRPSWVSARAMQRMVVLVSVLEIVLAFGLVFQAAGSAASLVVGGLFFALVTTYGAMGIRLNGDCGCSGIASEVALRGFLLRNISLFTALAVGVWLGPGLGTVLREPDGYVISVVAAPVFLLLGVMLWRLTVDAAALVRSGN